MRSGDGSKRVRLPWTTPEALNVLLRAFMGVRFQGLRSPFRGSTPGGRGGIAGGLGDADQPIDEVEISR